MSVITCRTENPKRKWLYVKISFLYEFFIHKNWKSLQVQNQIYHFLYLSTMQNKAKHNKNVHALLIKTIHIRKSFYKQVRYGST